MSIDALLPATLIDMTSADRLAKDNGWDIFYALRVIEEYRRFAFLIVTAGHVAVPSDQVDQAWHQHLPCLPPRQFEAEHCDFAILASGVWCGRHRVVGNRAVVSVSD